MGRIGSWLCLFAFVLMFGLSVAPLTGASTAVRGEYSQTAANSMAGLQNSQVATRTAGTSVVLGEGYREGKPVHDARPRVMALIGIGLVAIGVLLRRREGTRI